MPASNNEKWLAKKKKKLQSKATKTFAKRKKHQTGLRLYEAKYIFSSDSQTRDKQRKDTPVCVHDVLFLSRQSSLIFPGKNTPADLVQNRIFCLLKKSFRKPL